MSQLSKTQIQKLILEAVQELKSELEPKKDKNGVNHTDWDLLYQSGIFS